MKKDFFANVDGDKILFFSINLNADGTPVDSKMIDKDYVLSNNPTVLNITFLNYFPEKNSIWNGSTFIESGNQENKQACSAACPNGCETIAFLIDNVYYGGIGYCVGVSTNNMLIAALSSNPEVTFEVVGA